MPQFDINPDLSVEDRALVLDTLTQLRHAFAAPATAPTASPGVQHTIILTDPHPIKQAPYRQSPVKQEAVRAEVQRLLRNHIIVPSSSPWSSPVSLVPKADGSWRMVIDYRRVNARTRKDAYPVPLIEACLNACKDADWMSIIDVKDAYHHIEMALESRGITAFVTPDGLFEWNRMPFGLANAPATFQRYVDQQLREFIGKFCAIFFDDCLVYTTGTLAQHMGDVSKVLTKLHSVGLEASANKCRFGYKELLFVGHLVGRGTICPDPDKIRAITEYPLPRTLTALKAFLGLANYYRRFISGFAMHARPLYQMLKKDTLFEWSQDRLMAFEALKTALVSAPCLYAPDFARPFVLQTDASAAGIGAVLSQHVEGEEHPVGFVSRQLNKAEQNYSPTEWECLAVVWAMGQFEPFLIDAPFVVHTDHSALQWLKTKRTDNKRLERWALKLQEFPFEIAHRPGRANANADALSRGPREGTAPADAADVDDSLALGTGPRAPHFIRLASVVDLVTARVRVGRPRSGAGEPPAAPRVDEVAAPPLSTVYEFTDMDLGLLAEVAAEQRTAEDTRDLYAYLQHRQVPAGYTEAHRRSLIRRAAQFVLIEVEPDVRVLFFFPASNTRSRHPQQLLAPRLVVPPTYRPSLIALYHSSLFGGHSGVKHTLRKVATRYYWDSLYPDVTAHVAQCSSCQRTKAERHAVQRATGALSAPLEPWELVSLDLAGPLRGARDFSHVLLAVDHFTGYLVTVPLAATDAAAVARAFVEHVVCRFGMPRRILSDRGSNFTSALFKDLACLLGIKHHFTASHHPQANGKTERFVGILKQTLMANLEDYAGTWLDALQTTTFAINATPNETTTYSPFFLTYGRHPVIPADSLQAVTAALEDFSLQHEPEAYAAHLATLLGEAHAHIRAQTEDEVARRRREDAHATRVTVYREGDLVWLRDPRVGTSGGLPALARPYSGPFVVVHVISPTIYVIQAVKDGAARGGLLTVHSSRLRLRQQSDTDAPTTSRDAAASHIEPLTPPSSRRRAPADAPADSPASAALSRHRAGQRVHYGADRLPPEEERPESLYSTRDFMPVPLARETQPPAGSATADTAAPMEE